MLASLRRETGYFAHHHPRRLTLLYPDRFQYTKIEERLDVQVVSEPEVWASFTGATASLNVLMWMIAAIMAGAAVLGVMNQMFTVVRQRRRGSFRRSTLEN
ncbi:MAG: hypothetical protein AB1801_23110 [Chloroflexota bacterium]